MSYESPLKYFRDQDRDPDKYKEEHPNWHDQELPVDDSFENETKVLENKNQIQSEKIAERLGSASEKYKETIDIIKSAGLKPEFKDESEEQKIIENRREMILKYLGTILNDIRNYLTQVNFLQLQRMETFDSPEQYKSAIGASDGLRSVYHNKLIADLKIAMRLININFNADFPENFRIEEETKMTDRKGLTEEQLKEKMDKREYQHFPYPVGVFIDFSKAPKDPQGEREYIAHWALTLYTDLSALETDLK